MAKDCSCCTPQIDIPVCTVPNCPCSMKTLVTSNELLFDTKSKVTMVMAKDYYVSTINAYNTLIEESMDQKQKILIKLQDGILAPGEKGFIAFLFRRQSSKEFNPIRQAQQHGDEESDEQPYFDTSNLSQPQMKIVKQYRRISTMLKIGKQLMAKAQQYQRKQIESVCSIGSLEQKRLRYMIQRDKFIAEKEVMKKQFEGLNKR